MFYGNLITLVFCSYISSNDAAIIPTTDRQGRLSEVEWNNYNFRESEGYGTYSFGYDIDDPENNNVQFRNEEKLSNGSVVGSYGFLDPSGEVYLVKYIADERGYRASVENTLRLSFLKPINIETFPLHEEQEPASNEHVESENGGARELQNIPVRRNFLR